MKKIIIIALIGILIFNFAENTFPVYAEEKNQVQTSAEAAVLYEPITKAFLYEKNADRKLPMASTTKIMTALLALENCDINEIITVPKEAVGIEGSSVYLRENDTLSIADLIYSLMLRSANDAATVLALKMGGDIESFARMMTDRAIKLGLNNTRFKNPHGLDNENHYTTAHDLAIISACAMQNPKFREIVSTYKYSFLCSDSLRTVVNHNKLLKLYDGAIGIKTGYTRKCGRCLVSAANRDGLNLIAVTLNAPDDWNDHMKMLDFGFKTLELTPRENLIDSEFKIPVIGGEKEFVMGCEKNPEQIYLIGKKEKDVFSAKVFLRQYCIAPIKKGDIVGTVIYMKNGKEYKKIPITTTEDINIKATKEKHLWKK